MYYTCDSHAVYLKTMNLGRTDSTELKLHVGEFRFFLRKYMTFHPQNNCFRIATGEMVTLEYSVKRQVGDC